MTAELRQQLLTLWVAGPTMSAQVLGWSFADGTCGLGPQPEGDPPYATGLAALQAGWRLLQMSLLTPAYPGLERQPSFLKHEYLFERLIPIGPAGDPVQR